MCFFIRSFNDETKTLWIATQNIVCYKKLVPTYDPYRDYYNKLARSPFRNDFVYELGRTYKGKLDLASKVNKDGVLPPSVLRFPYTQYVEEGFHSCTNLADAMNMRLSGDYNGAVYRCVIPKGAKFWHDPINNEYASDQLRVLKLLRKSPSGQFTKITEWEHRQLTKQRKTRQYGKI